jgi:hypothetical protein
MSGAALSRQARASGRFLQGEVDRLIHEGGVQLDLGGRYDARIVERHRALAEIDAILLPSILPFLIGMAMPSGELVLPVSFAPSALNV